MKKYPYRHVSITYWSNGYASNNVHIYDEDKDRNSPEGHLGRSYDNVRNCSMLRLTGIVSRNSIKPNVVMGENNVSIFFWLKRKGKR